MTVIVVVIDESKDSLIKRRAVFLRLDVNIVIFYRSPKSFYPDVVLCPAPAVHTDLHFRMLGARRSSTRTPEGLLRSMVAAASQCPCGWWRSSDGPSRHTGRHVGWHCRRTSMPSRSLLYGRSNWLWDYRGLPSRCRQGSHWCGGNGVPRPGTGGSHKKPPLRQNERGQIRITN